MFSLWYINFFLNEAIMLHQDGLFNYQNPREASSRSRIFLNSLVYVCMYLCVTPPGQTENDTDLKFGTHTPIDLF